LIAFEPHVEERSSVVYSGVDDDGIELGEPDHERPVVLAAGRMAHEKGFDVLLHACALLRDRGLELDVVIAGDGPERQMLTDLIHELELSDHVTMPGWVHPEEMWTFLQQATVIAVPSRWDAFPRSAVEGALMERPIVASAVGGLTESVVHGETGLLVEPENTEALAVALSSLVHDPDRARAMGAAGRTRARDLFSMEAVVTAYDQIYRGFLR
jgi:glycosyltransferase involved in cell wall biosynthesis